MMFVIFAGPFNLTVAVDSLFFIGSHLVALNHSGKLGVWHAVSQNWQVSYFPFVYFISVYYPMFACITYF